MPCDKKIKLKKHVSKNFLALNEVLMQLQASTVAYPLSMYLFVLVYLLKSLVHTLLYIWTILNPNTLKQYWDYSSHLRRSSEGCVFTAAGRPSIITRSSVDSFLSIQKQL